MFRKKMAADDFTTILSKPYTAHKIKGKPHFCNIRPYANGIVYVRLEDFRTFVFIFMSVVEVFVRISKKAKKALFTRPIML